MAPTSLLFRFAATLLIAILASAAVATEPAEYRARREAVAKAMGQDSMLILTSPPEVKPIGNEPFPFRQDNDLFYLTGVNVPDTTLVLLPGESSRREILFVSDLSLETQTWKGPSLGITELSQMSGIKEVISSSLLNTFLNAAFAGLSFNDPKSYGFFAPPSFPAYFAAMKKGQAEVFFAFNRREAENPAFLTLMKSIREKYPELRFRDATHILVNQREIKSPAELELIQRAIDITIEAQKAAMRRAKSATHEYQVQAMVEYTFRDRGASGPAFPSIVASGMNTTILHYPTQNGPIFPTALMLLDVGAEVDHYAADMTNTFPVNGTFTQEQKAIYEAVYRTNRATMKLYRPKATLAQINKQAFAMIGKELQALGLTTDANDDEQTKLYYMHGIGHQLGLAVHDAYDRERSLEAGMVVTVEPGIYVNAARIRASKAYNALSESTRAKLNLALTKYDGIGVRLEDDVLVTSGEPKNLSAKLPRSVAEIENFMRTFN